MAGSTGLEPATSGLTVRFPAPLVTTLADKCQRLRDSAINGVRNGWGESAAVRAQKGHSPRRSAQAPSCGPPDGSLLEPLTLFATVPWRTAKSRKRVPPVVSR